MALLKFIFTWWNGSTFGTRWFTLRRGHEVGRDVFGNTYYQDKKAPQRRWVIFHGQSEASSVPPGWHGWLHGTVDTCPVDDAYQAFEWEAAPEPNHSGTPRAYRPAGSLLNSERSIQGQKTYEAWSPGS